jgi:hypothetical protein
MVGKRTEDEFFCPCAGFRGTAKEISPEVERVFLVSGHGEPVAAIADPTEGAHPTDGLFY